MMNINTLSEKNRISIPSDDKPYQFLFAPTTSKLVDTMKERKEQKKNFSAEQKLNEDDRICSEHSHR